jgi:hypothetical protein
VTGHSLGGALAVLAGWLFNRKFTPVHQIYTFGGPMVGNDDAAQAINKALAGKLFRYVDGVDPVPKLPTVSLADNVYIHCDKEVGLGAVEEAQSAVGFLKALAAQTAKGVLEGTLVDDLWKGVLARIDAHMMPNYRKRLAGG